MILSILFTGAVSQDISFWLASYPYWNSGDVPAAGGSYSYCDIDNNAKVGWPVNSECNNAGSCVIHTPFQGFQSEFTWGKCQCADPADETNFVYEDAAWNFQIFSGNTCTETSFKLFGTISYLIAFSEWGASSVDFQGKAGMLECAVGDGPGIEFNTADPLEVGAAWRASPDLTPVIRAVIENNEHWSAPTEDLRQNGYFDYLGLVVPYWGSSVESQHCRVCSDAHLCGIGEDEYGDGQSSEGNENGGWLKISFATNYNTYYGHDCQKINGVMPVDQDGYQDEPPCELNDDDGHAAQAAFKVSTFGDDNGDHHKSHFLELTTQDSGTLVYDGGADWGIEHIYGMDWDSTIQITRTATTETSVEGTSTNSLRFPSVQPTLAPTPVPSPEPTAAVQDCFVLGYTHQPSDLQFKGVAQSGDRGCRWGLDESWPGGDEPMMCDSPYVVCLPEANTPNVGFWTNEGTEPYQSDTAVYTIAMCKRECAYDQRCTGFEFWVEGEADGAFTGKCSLVDDIPIEMGTSADPSVTTESDLDSKNPADFSNTALCYEKDVACNPYFGEDDLSEIMLNCYCPNNRKGFYTKNVKRTVGATKFCGSDPDQAITKRIREAQANRMFHLCENWCLFNTQSPRTESWYHDPWEECWREQYAGVGTHRSYCYRVIRDPFTIEQFFIDTRAANMCAASDAAKGFGNNVNTPAPVQSGVATTGWYLANAEDSCDDKCADEGLLCNNDDIMTVVNNAGNIEGFMTAAGYNCNGNVVQADNISPNGQDGWALPAIGPDGECIERHPNANKQGVGAEDLYVDCSVSIGVGYQRLCACGSLTAP